ncbi:MAG: hypothetical protein JWP06_1024 [Candidatus Saccharibacteria bacterium]|nr:hypothetical protein [Candidatus Saccharibacteria bacterium]
MSTYTLKSVAQRGSMLGAVLAVVVATIFPAASAFADSLNPLTERSLMLSSSAPGFANTDGSGNSVDAPNAVGENYAPAGSGPNGRRTGETFSFKVSSDNSLTGRAIKAFTLQYCTEAAGLCQGPGDNTGDARVATANRETNATAHPLGRSDLDVVGSWTEGSGAGQFQVLVDGSPVSGWAMTSVNAEDDAHSGNLTGKKNLIQLTATGAGAVPAIGHPVVLKFNPSESTFITNPGIGSFFVKINTYDTATNAQLIPTVPAATNAHLMDGGVTVANVMTDSIHITTKVLETMAFSVGTRNPDTQNVSSHGSCDAIEKINSNRLNLGNTDAENSLETTRAYDTNSYWRLSSNSSGGATVYYSGNTLQNTVGDFIAPIGADPGNTIPNDGAMDYSHPGTEQFGLALVSPVETLGTGTFPSNHLALSISPLNIVGNYSHGDLTSISNTADITQNARFAFQKSSLTTPVPIAQETSTVISCATSKVRYVANIAADTPAGVYTTKINYLAAPQY